MDQSPQPGLSFDTVGDPHLSIQGRQEDHQLNGVYIVGNHHQLSLLVLHHQYGAVLILIKGQIVLVETSPLPAAIFFSWVRSLYFSYCVSGL